jgi:hypothetical protein
MRLNRLLVAGATAAFTLAGCKASESIAVTNPNNPDVVRVFATADGIEGVLRNGFNQILGATHGTTGALLPAALVMSFESYGSVANFGMNLRAAMPRTPIDNNKGGPTANENFRDFQQLSLRGRLIANGITALDSLMAHGLSLGSPAQNQRARSFGFFTLALANGNMALMYDSVAVSRPGLSLTTVEVPPLVAYPAAMQLAINQLDSAIAVASAPTTGSNGFPLPNDWIRTTGGTPIGTTSLDTYLRLVRSTKARFRAGVARTPAERAAVNWAAVVADASNGITSDVILDLDNSLGWTVSWLNQAAVFAGWHSTTPYIIGMADTSSNYANWLAVDRGSRVSFLIFTPDKRFPKGNTRAAQVAASPAANAVLPTVYFRNRPSADPTGGDAWGSSFYDFVRYRHYRQQSQKGPWNWMTQTESEMLWAEGLIRLGREAEAVPLINRTRVANGLPPFPATATAATPAPLHPGGGATSCVPRTPTAPGGALECGSLFEAMKWEKRLETTFSGYAQWFIDSRGWNDLPDKTSTMWPVPYQEMDARLQPFYNSRDKDPWVEQGNSYGFGVGSR